MTREELQSAIQDFWDETFNHSVHPEIGPYIKTLGGLDSSTTNQKFFRVANGEICDLMNDRFVKKTHPN